jgi:S-adenosylmethionine synthetase
MSGNNTFMSAPKVLFTSESVTEGHPDKLCDQVSDAILDAFLQNDPMSRVACETAATTGLVVVMGEITSEAYVDVQKVIRQTVKNIGYDDASFGFDADSCGVIVSLKEQSPDIAQGVNCSVEVRTSTAQADEYEAEGAGDQGMMTGFACNETPEYMPLAISLAHQLCRRLSQVRKDGTLPYLRPDGKSQVTVEYQYGKPARVDTVVIAAQHDDGLDHSDICEDIIKQVIEPIVPDYLKDSGTKYLVNTTGRFVVGGPAGDTGLTGRKIIVDTYGGLARHGGGCFSGKDPTKVDRSGAYAARYVAKNIVAAGIADRFEVQIAYAIGKAHPVSIMFETFGTARIPDEQILALINEHFDLRPAAIIEHLNLRRPIYTATAAYGHFGRDDIDAPWEKTDLAETLREKAGIAAAPQLQGA